MHYRRVGLAVALTLGLVVTARAEDKVSAPHVHRSPEMEKCIKACHDCAVQCESCFNHCAHLAAEGKKEHLATLKSCVDCGDLCIVAAKIMLRDGALVGAACDGCAKACDGCAAACDKFPMDDHMKACAKACKDCSKACQEMEKSISGTATRTSR
jgi:hypothetical protein